MNIFKYLSIFYKQFDAASLQSYILIKIILLNKLKIIKIIFKSKTNLTIHDSNLSFLLCQ